ncbi:conjugation system SOS inhibitor PsiB family protein [Pectobacterium carotovorum]|uniref:conjugation system SOS inhibitor PsiB family protein n=1 Tax=Pectobacterium carotovorum TaxID=554 RepID=UPI0029D93406|nr:conjugation system SOS inhibitor PsiB family protein [Pectobacterium carotovorum]MDX6917857.1 conjugation system SOS inhibitor PsiB family protein [Pectobacterium carotovorum]
MTKEQELTLLTLIQMSGSEYEQYAERGEDYRHRLSNAVIKHLPLPEYWRCEAELRGEFGGCSPVHLHLAHAQVDDLIVNVCSGNDDIPLWSAYIKPDAESTVWVYMREQFEPAILNDVLLHLHECVIAGASSRDEVIMMMRKQGAAV